MCQSFDVRPVGQASRRVQHRQGRVCSPLKRIKPVIHTELQRSYLRELSILPGRRFCELLNFFSQILPRRRLQAPETRGGLTLSRGVQKLGPQVAARNMIFCQNLKTKFRNLGRQMHDLGVCFLLLTCSHSSQGSHAKMNSKN